VFLLGEQPIAINGHVQAGNLGIKMSDERVGWWEHKKVPVRVW